MSQPVDALQALLTALTRRRTSVARYAVPACWFDPQATGERLLNPFDAYADVVRRLLDAPPIPMPQGEAGAWSRQSVAYNLFVRLATAWDHDGDGELTLPLNPDGWRETGTFLKSIALLPRLRAMGVNTLHLLPVNAIGNDGRKGVLGSPYASRNAYLLDDMLGEPALDVPIETQFRAFVQAAHRLGMRVVVEFVFRTAAKDCDWAAEHPEWFYWIRADVPDRAPGSTDERAYGLPLFTAEELATIEAWVGRRGGAPLPPHAVYRAMFTPPPPRESLFKTETGAWRGRLPDGTLVRIPGAFADWPPTEGQPPWTDVTYLRLYDHPDYNYIAYNTVRFYPPDLATPENRVADLWAHIVGILPHYIAEFDVDGVMLDMGHALPADLKQAIMQTARAAKPDFAFWEENFDASLTGDPRGYNVAMGPMTLISQSFEALRTFLPDVAAQGMRELQLAAGENHNTHRVAALTGGVRRSRVLAAIHAFVPGVPWVHNGFEVGETAPVNTGIDFTAEELRFWTTEKLALFSPHALPWLNTETLIPWLTRLYTVRHAYADLFTDSRPGTFTFETHGAVWVLTRQAAETSRRFMLVVNTDFEHAGTLTLTMPTTVPLADVLNDRILTPDPDGRLPLMLEPGGVVLLRVE
ncbi:hypothetical protein ARMA_0814 [Ardenticatena maritima]|uniref:Glycosyl hydrolase family 13 catalytic domain-containing protein n=1 Tax=Ardenticatena maritima TaxID=872965 RepID=A0A0M8K7I9_9CHLR|nr:hypothetical protein [Ardenticatena maritima]GAP62391.1 hypothetical protein ARMA_0814 [Ardenticatena maritima]